MSNGVKILVLAAGQGKRMGIGDMPKVLVLLKGKPMLEYLFNAIKNSGVCDTPTIVIGKGAEKVKEIFGPGYQYVLQQEQLGTGHAVMVAKEALKDATDVLILYGDHPLVSSQLIKNLADTHLASGGVLTIPTVIVENYDDWREEFLSFSRVVRNNKNLVIRLVEKKDATAEHSNINERWPGYMCFKAEWLWENLKKLNTNNAQGEYYLTDLVKMAVDQGHEITTIEITELKEALGINTSEQLETIEKLL